MVVVVAGTIFLSGGLRAGTLEEALRAMADGEVGRAVSILGDLAVKKDGPGPEALLSSGC
jgi:hypothetical protein